MHQTSTSEIEVLTQVEHALAALDASGARRVLAWLVDKYGLVEQQPARSRTAAQSPSRDAGHGEDTDFASLFGQAQPETEKDRALLAGYWFQVMKGTADLDGFALNRELRNLGHPVSNITKALSYLINQRPQLVIQVRKSGSTQQARKKYRLTKSGIAEAESLIARNSVA